jgi:hypothetical protein
MKAVAPSKKMKLRICEWCGKPLPDKNTFRRIAIKCSKEGYYILDGSKLNLDVAYCLCRAQIVSRLTSVRKQRSRVKRMMVFVARFRPYEWKTKRISQQKRVKQKALQRQLETEDSVLWDWKVFDGSGKSHVLEDILDTSLIRDMIRFQRKSLPVMRRLLSKIAHDSSLVSAASLPHFELEPNDLEADLEELWQKRLDDED